MTKPKNKKQQPKTNEPEKNVEQDEVITAKESEDNKPEPKSETPEKQEESYSIYEYLKKNPAVLIAAVSGLIAIISTGLKLSSYLYHIGYLNYWNIDNKLISVLESYWLEDIVLSFALLTCSIIHIGVINETVSTFRKQKYYIKVVKVILMENEYNFNKSKRKVKKKRKSNNSYNIKINKDVYMKLHRWLKRSNFNCLVQVIANFLLVELLWGMIMYIAYLKQKNTNNYSLISFVCGIILIGLLIAVLGYYFTLINKKEIKKECIEKIKKCENNNFELPIKKIYKIGIKGFLSNNYIVRNSFMFLLIIICFLVMEQYQGKQEAENLKDHICVIKYDEKDYAIIAQDTDNIIAERIVIKGSSADIYVNEQILIPKEKIEMEVHSFEEIHKK